MGLLTRTEIERKIDAIDKQIELAQESESYTISSGLTSQSVKRQSLTALFKARDYWLNKLEDLVLSECGAFRPVPVVGFRN